MVVPSRKIFISFEIKPDINFSDSNTKKKIFTTFWFKNCKNYKVLLPDLGQSEMNIFDFSLCVIGRAGSKSQQKLMTLFMDDS